MARTAEDWKRVAATVRHRRAELGLSQEEAASASEGMISSANWRVIEGAGRTKYRPSSLIGVARALGWSDDSVERILAGGPPLINAPTSGDFGALYDAMNPEQAAIRRLQQTVADQEERIQVLEAILDVALSIVLDEQRPAEPVDDYTFAKIAEARATRLLGATGPMTADPREARKHLAAARNALVHQQEVGRRATRPTGVPEGLDEP